MRVLPEYDTVTFVEHYLAPSMDQLVTHLAVPADRDVAFAAIGRLAHAVGSAVRPFIDCVMKHVRSALQASAHNCANPYPAMPTAAAAAFLWPTATRPDDTSSHTTAVFNCVGMLVCSEVAGAVHELLDDMIACALSAELFNVLTHISPSLPALLRPIQVRMLDALARTLTGRPFVPCGAPPHDVPAATSSKVNGVTHSPKTPSRHRKGAAERDTTPPALRLALEILGIFDFSERTLTEFVRDACLPYMAHSAGDVRLAAARTCAALLLLQLASQRRIRTRTRASSSRLRRSTPCSTRSATPRYSPRCPAPLPLDRATLQRPLPHRWRAGAQLGPSQESACVRGSGRTHVPRAFLPVPRGRDARRARPIPPRTDPSEYTFPVLSGC